MNTLTSVTLTSTPERQNFIELARHISGGSDTRESNLTNNNNLVRGRSQIPSHVTRPFFDSGLPPPSPRSPLLECWRATRCFDVRLLLVYFGLASRSGFAVGDCVTLESFLRFSHIP